MATYAVAQSPTRSGSPDRRSKEIPPPLSLTVEAPAASSPFPSPSSSFVPPPMPGAHEFANKAASGLFVRRKKSNCMPAATEEQCPITASKETQGSEGLRESNGTNVSAKELGAGPSAALTPITPTPPSSSATPTPTASSPPEAGKSSYTVPEPKADPVAAPPTPSAVQPSAEYGRDTPTQMHIALPPPPSSPSQIFGNAALMRTPSGSGTASKHTSLSSSRPAPPSPSPVNSRRQSTTISLRHRSGISTASTSSVKFGTLKASQLSQVTKRKGEIKVRDFAFPIVDPRHKGRGADAPKVIKKLLKHHGSLEPGSRRESGMSESSVDSEEGSSRRSSGFGSWGAFRWASKIGGAWGFGTTAGGGESASRTSGSGGYTPSQQDFERNFDESANLTDSPTDDPDEYSSDYDNDGEGDGEPEELLPGLYRALYDFDPEGTAEMGLKEGQVVRVVGRGGGVGWAIVVRPDTEAREEGAENNWALVPESYLRVVKFDEVDSDEMRSQDDSEQEVKER